MLQNFGQDGRHNSPIIMTRVPEINDLQAVGFYHDFLVAPELGKYDTVPDC